MSDGEAIKTLILILMGMIGAFYANFLWEMRKLRRDMHGLRNIVNQHGMRLSILEKHAKLIVFEEPEE